MGKTSWGGGGEKCSSCLKTVYVMERLEVAGRIMHRNCFKCHKCNNKLNIGSFSVGGDKMFCTTHYKQLFTEKGSYDFLGTGSSQERDKWSKNIEAASPEETEKSHD